MKEEARERCRELRSRGWSIGRIAKEVEVSKSSVSRWVSDVELTDEQRTDLYLRQTQSRRRADRRVFPKSRSAAEWHEIQRDAFRHQRQQYQDDGRQRAKGVLSGAIDDPLHLMGAMLYWAEGSKDRTCCAMANSDPYVLRLFVRFLHECMEVPLDRIAVHCHYHSGNGLDVSEIERHWLDELGLPATSIRKSVLCQTSAGRGKKVGKLPYGTAHVRGGGVRVVQHIYGAIQEYGGFEQPEWRDM